MDCDLFDRCVGAFVRSRRRALNLSREDLAARASCALAWVDSVEAGAARLTSADAVRLAQALELAVGEFVEGANRDRPRMRPRLVAL